VAVVFLPETVKRRARICVWFLMGTALSTSVGALASGTANFPYREIISRNSFGLKAPEEKPEPTPAVPLRPKIRLVGVTTILGKKIAFLVIAGSESGRLPECLMMAEGTAENGVLLKEIDEKAAIVTVLNHGQEQVLEFKEGAN